MSAESTLPPPSAGTRPLGERLLVATLLLGAGDAAGKILALVITVIRTRSLTAAEFGGFGFIIQTIGMFAQAAGFSLGLAATRYIALYQHSELAKAREVAQFIVIFGLLTTTGAAGLLYWFAPWLVAELPGLIEPLRWSTLILITQTLSGLLLGLLAGMEKFRLITISVFGQNVVMLALTAWWAPLWGLNGTIWAMAGGFCITLAMALWKTWELLAPPWLSWKRLWSHRRILIDFCIPSLLGGLIILPANWFATKIIAAHHGPVGPLIAGLVVLPPSWLVGLGLGFHFFSGLRQVALFTAADQFRPMLTLLTNLVAQPMMPLVTQQIRLAEQPELPATDQQRARRSAQRAIERSFQLAACLVLPAHAFFAFAAPYVMALFGRTFANEWIIFIVVLAWGAIAGMASLIGVALYAQGQIWLQNSFMALYAVMLVGVTWLTQSWGEFALAVGNLAGTLTSFGIGAWMLHRSGFLSWHAIKVQVLAYAWITVVSLVSYGTAAAWRPLCIPLAVGITCLVLLWWLRADMKHVIALFRRKLLSLRGLSGASSIR